MYHQDDPFSNGHGIFHDNIPRRMITQLHFNMITIQHTPSPTSKQHDYYSSNYTLIDHKSSSMDPFHP
jgi:hypothetical protein